MHSKDYKFIFIAAFVLSLVIAHGQDLPMDTKYVNPFLGTAPLTNPADIGFTPPWRVWAGLGVSWSFRAERDGSVNSHHEV